MYIPFEHLVPQDHDRRKALLRKRLTKKNPYGLAAGDYLFHDLYPSNPLVGQDMYFTVERVRGQELLLTARLALRKSELILSPKHLQSPEAPQVLTWLKELLGNELQLLERLEERLDQVLITYALHLLQMEEMLPEEFEYSCGLLQEQREQNDLAQGVLERLAAFQAAWALEKSMENNLIPFPQAEDAGRKKSKAKSKTTSKKRQKSLAKHSGTLILRVDLKGSKPKIWRRLQVPARLTLTQMHEVLQIAMGWQNYHLWQFTDRQNRCYLYSDDDFPSMREELNPDAYFLGDLLVKPGDWLDYEYDFGDSWEHRLSLEEQHAEEAPCQLIKAVNACPPEDCGGIWGYADILQMLKKKRKNAEDREILEWLGGDFDPTAFDLESANRALNRLFN